MHSPLTCEGVHYTFVALFESNSGQRCEMICECLVGVDAFGDGSYAIGVQSGRLGWPAVTKSGPPAKVPMLSRGDGRSSDRFVHDRNVVATVVSELHY